MADTVMCPQSPFHWRACPPAAGNAVIRQAQLSTSSGLVSAAEGWLAQGHALPVAAASPGEGIKAGSAPSEGRHCEGHCGSCVFCGVYPWASLLPLPCPVSFLSPPQGMVPGTLRDKHPVPKLFSESASWEAHLVPAATSPFLLMTALQRLAEQPAPGGSSLSYLTTQPLAWSGVWARPHLGPSLGGFWSHSPRSQGRAGFSGADPRPWDFSWTVVAVPRWLPAQKEAFTSTGTNLVGKPNHAGSTWLHVVINCPSPSCPQKGADQHL